MKKTVITLLITLALALIIPMSAYAEGAEYVVDNADLLSEADESALREKLQNLSGQYEFDIVALTVDNLDGKTPMEYADDYYDYNGYRNDGCLLLISTDRDWWISTKGYGITAITDYGIEVLEYEAIRPYFGNDDWAGGYNKYADMIEEYIIEAKNGTPYDINNKYTGSSGTTYDFSSDSYEDSDSTEEEDKRSALIVSLIVSLTVAAIIVKMVKSGYKPVRFKASAADYLVDGSLKVTALYDRFLYSNVTKTEIETSSSSGGGSSTHTSSSGSSHGGGGGKF